MAQPGEINPSILNDIERVATEAHKAGAPVQVSPLTLLALVSLSRLAFGPTPAGTGGDA